MGVDIKTIRAWVDGPEMGTHKACKYLMATCNEIERLRAVVASADARAVRWEDKVQRYSKEVKEAKARQKEQERITLRYVKHLHAAEAKVKSALEALESLSRANHEGEGFCYEPHGYRKCSCHVGEAKEALAKLKSQETKTDDRV